MRTTFEVPIRCVNPTNNRQGWKAVYFRGEKQKKAVAVLFPKKVGPRPYVVTLTRVGPRKLDSDNVQASLKHIRDQVAACLGVDDGDESLVRWIYEQAKGQYAVRIEVTSVGHLTDRFEVSP